MSEHMRYSMLIEWSEEDRAYLVTLPEWADRVLMPATHGDTYDEAVQRGQEVLTMLIENARAESQPLPAPRLFTASFGSALRDDFTPESDVDLPDATARSEE
jgi:antitoxin HicB